MSKNGRNTDENELSLWHRFVEGINPLKHRDPIKPSIKNKIKHQNISNAVPIAPLPSVIDTPKHAGNNTLDRRTLDKLKKGKMPIEGIIDLHDKNQDQAYHALIGFVANAYQSQKRCILVITGKGTRTKIDDWDYGSNREGIGVLKSRLPDWVSQSPLDSMVLRYIKAARHHGGSGAYYLYLKRQRP